MTSLFVAAVSERCERLRQSLLASSGSEDDEVFKKLTLFTSLKAMVEQEAVSSSSNNNNSTPCSTAASKIIECGHNLHTIRVALKTNNVPVLTRALAWSQQHFDDLPACMKAEVVRAQGQRDCDGLEEKLLAAMATGRATGVCGALDLSSLDTHTLSSLLVLARKVDVAPLSSSSSSTSSSTAASVTTSRQQQATRKRSIFSTQDALTDGGDTEKEDDDEDNEEEEEEAEACDVATAENATSSISYPPPPRTAALEVAMKGGEVCLALREALRAHDLGRVKQILMVIDERVRVHVKREEEEAAAKLYSEQQQQRQKKNDEEEAYTPSASSSSSSNSSSSNNNSSSKLQHGFPVPFDFTPTPLSQVLPPVVQEEIDQAIAEVDNIAIIDTLLIALASFHDGAPPPASLLQHLMSPTTTTTTTAAASTAAAFPSSPPPAVIAAADAVGAAASSQQKRLRRYNFVNLSVHADIDVHTVNTSLLDAALTHVLAFPGGGWVGGEGAHYSGIGSRGGEGERMRSDRARKLKHTVLFVRALRLAVKEDDWIAVETLLDKEGLGVVGRSHTHTQTHTPHTSLDIPFWVAPEEATAATLATEALHTPLVFPFPPTTPSAPSSSSASSSSSSALSPSFLSFTHTLDAAAQAEIYALQKQLFVRKSMVLLLRQLSTGSALCERGTIDISTVQVIPLEAAINEATKGLSLLSPPPPLPLPFSSKKNSSSASAPASTLVSSPTRTVVKDRSTTQNFSATTPTTRGSNSSYAAANNNNNSSSKGTSASFGSSSTRFSTTISSMPKTPISAAHAPKSSSTWRQSSSPSPARNNNKSTTMAATRSQNNSNATHTQFPSPLPRTKIAPSPPPPPEYTETQKQVLNLINSAKCVLFVRKLLVCGDIGRAGSFAAEVLQGRLPLEVLANGGRATAEGGGEGDWDIEVNKKAENEGEEPSDEFEKLHSVCSDEIRVYCSQINRPLYLSRLCAALEKQMKIMSNAFSVDALAAEVAKEKERVRVAAAAAAAVTAAAAAVTTTSTATTSTTAPLSGIKLLKKLVQDAKRVGLHSSTELGYVHVSHQAEKLIQTYTETLRLLIRATGGRGEGEDGEEDDEEQGEEEQRASKLDLSLSEKKLALRQQQRAALLRRLPTHDGSYLQHLIEKAYACGLTGHWVMTKAYSLLSKIQEFETHYAALCESEGGVLCSSSSLQAVVDMATRFNFRKHPLAVSAQTALRLSPLAFSKYLVAMSVGGTNSNSNSADSSGGPSPFSAVTISLRRKKKFLSLPAAHNAFALDKFPLLTSSSIEETGIVAQRDLLHSDSALSKPLTQLTPALAELAVKLFTSHIRTIEKPPLSSSLTHSTKSLALVHFELVLIGRVCVSMRDEILLQLVKQLRYPPMSSVVGGGIVNSTNSNMHTEHPDPLARERLWRALCVCVCAFPPSQAFENFFEQFLLEHASSLSPSWSLYDGSNNSLSEQNHAHTARRCLRLMHTSIYLYGQDKSMSHLNVHTHIHAYAHHMQQHHHHHNNNNNHSNSNIFSRDARHESISILSLFLVQQWLAPETYTTALLKKERVGAGSDFNAELAFLDPAFDNSDRSRQQQQEQQGEERPLVADGGKITVYEIGGGGGVLNKSRSVGGGGALSFLPSSKSFLWLPKKMLQTHVDASGGGGKGSKIDLDGGGLEGFCRGTREDWRERFKRVFSQNVNAEEQVGRKCFLDAMVKLGGSSAEEEKAAVDEDSSGTSMDWLDACVLKFLVYGEKPASMISLSRELRAASNSFYGICSASEEEIRTMRVRREWLIQHTKTHADVALTPPFTLHERQVLASLLWDEVLEKLIVHSNAASSSASESRSDATSSPVFLTWPVFRDVIIIGLETALVEEEMKRELEQEEQDLDAEEE